MKNIWLTFLIIFCTLITNAQESRSRIAVFDPTSTGTSIDTGTKIAIREIISSTVVNVGKHDIVERSLLEKVIEEQSFSNSGVVDENQATEIGKLAGANKIIVSVVTMTGGRNMLSIKLIDVKTASVEKQQVKVVTSGELLDVVEPMTLNLVGGDANFTSNIIEIQKEPDKQATETINTHSNLTTSYTSSYNNISKNDITKGIRSGMRYKDYKWLYKSSDYRPQSGDPYSPALSGIASFLIPGFGQILCGETTRGLKWFGGVASCYFLLGMMPVTENEGLLLTEVVVGSIGVICISIGSIVDAILVSKIKNMYYRDLKKISSIDFSLKPFITNTNPNQRLSLDNTSLGLSFNLTF